jgi:hypothetical protein
VQNIQSGAALSRRLHRDWYAKVNLKVGPFSRTFHVHTLVAAAFIGPRPAGQFIDHKDGNHENDQATNLKYVTPAQSNANRKARGQSRQSTGLPNIYRHAYGGYFARICHKGRNIRLGWFSEIEPAVAAVDAFKRDRQIP